VARADNRVPLLFEREMELGGINRNRVEDRVKWIRHYMEIVFGVGYEVVEHS
jgi:hypothetical protein